MPTTIVTEGWTAAGDRFRGMLRRQLLALGETGGFDVPASGGPDRVGPVPEGAVVYGFGRGGEMPPPGATRPVRFWPAGQGGAGEGDPVVREAEVRIVVPSHWSRACAVAAGARADRVSVVAPGIDGGTFAPLSRRDRDAVRANLGLGVDETALLHVGGGNETGLDLALRAFSRLRAAGARVRLLLATDDPDTPVDYGRTVREAAFDEPALREAGCLAAVTTLPGHLGPADWRMLHGAADLLVAPDRGCAFPFPMLEALACGCPVVTTRGGAADDLGDDDLAWRISGTVQRDAAGRLSIAPDLDELTDALAEIARGRGFDRLRFAAARMRLMREATWARSARRLAEALEDGAPRDPAGPLERPVLQGSPQPVGDRFVAAPSHDIASARRRATGRVTCPSPEDLSVVVQGPCLREATEPGAPSIDEAIASIRRQFPGAQVIVSTWHGSDVDGLDADDIVLSPDPGSLSHPRHPPNNINRMVTSTANGLAAASRPFCIKTRNDLRFASQDIIRRPLHAASATTGLERRIWTKAGKIDAFLRPYHPSDMMMYGSTADLRKLWGIPAAEVSDLFLPDPESSIGRMSSEQALFVGYLNSIGENVQLESSFDGRWHIIAGSVAHMLACFDVFDEDDVDLIMPQRFVDGKIPAFCYTCSEFDKLRSEFDGDPDATSRRIYLSFHQVLNGLLGQTTVVPGGA